MIPVVLICGRRTGSTFLQSCMNKHSQINIYRYSPFSVREVKGENKRFYEYYKKEYGFDRIKYLYEILINNLYEIEEDIFCIKIVYDQLYEDKTHVNYNFKEYSYMLEWLYFNNIKIIHLMRLDSINRFRSFTKLNRKRVQNFEDISNEYKKEMKEKFDEERKHFDNLINENRIRLFYENIVDKIEENKEIEKEKVENIKITDGNSFIDSVQKVTNKYTTYLNKEYVEVICDFLNIEYKEMYSNIKKNR